MNRTSRNTRNWTDDQLRAAVSSQNTWRGVARELGLAIGSTNGIRRHVRRLGLDTSHFRGARRWSEDDLRVAVAEAASWTEVIVRLDISDTSQARVRVRAAAQRLGVDLSHVNRESKGGLNASPPQLWVPDRSRIRVAAESIALLWFTLRGISAATPAEQIEYDLLVSLPSGVQRVQVKSGTCRDKGGSWHVGIGRRQCVADKSGRRVPYDPDELDYFFIIDGDGLLYFIPSTVVAGRTGINVGAYTEYLVGNASSLFTTAA